MPFTPFHMGPGIACKALLGGAFSLMIFGWTQILMDIQPLVVMITGEGHLHGFSHTFAGALLLAALAVVTGKYLSELALFLLDSKRPRIIIPWWVGCLSALIGAFSHVFLDAIMHSDVQPFFPLTANNPWLGLISIDALHKVCIYSGIIGGAVYFGVQALLQRRKPG